MHGDSINITYILSMILQTPTGFISSKHCHLLDLDSNFDGDEKRANFFKIDHTWLP